MFLKAHRDWELKSDNKIETLWYRNETLLPVTISLLHINCIKYIYTLYIQFILPTAINTLMHNKKRNNYKTFITDLK